MENIRLIYIKAGEKLLKSEVFGIADILPYLINGEMHLEENTLILSSPNRKTSFELPIELLEIISVLAEQEGISISKWVEKKLSSILK
ncbi:hypothetical protein ABGT24_25570 [Peribacillus frigoritolerans]|uniref:hypothetical protein n=1 Tax=Peribacillus frigoritolerans TaxID=450367 RepID=UPI00345D5A56